MSKLSRFKKNGGFQQLLMLIESCEPEKQKSLLQMVASEDPGWAHLIKVKALTFGRIIQWPVDILMEITPQLQDNSLAIIYRMCQSLPDKNLENHFLKSLPDLKAREIVELSNSIRFTNSDQIATTIRLLQVIRDLESKGKINFSTFDPSLNIDTKMIA
jgi:flagellar motor switch protein FliG